MEANAIARNTALSIKFLVSQLGAAGTLEQPSSSYMLPFLDREGLLPAHDQVLLHQCRFGRPYRKLTVFLTFGGLELNALALTCSPATPCGRGFHTTLVLVRDRPLQRQHTQLGCALLMLEPSTDTCAQTSS